MRTREGLRIAASLAAWNTLSQEAESDDADDQSSDVEWDSTDKHRVLIVIKKTTLQKLVGPESAEARRNMWRHGHPLCAVCATSFLRSLADESGAKIGPA